MSWTKLRLAMMNNSMLNSTCSSVKTTSVTIASIQGLLKKITVKSSTRTQQTELPITNSSLSANKATSSSTCYESEAAIAQNHRLSAKRKKDSYYNDMCSNYMEDLLEYGYMIQVELQSLSQQATYFIIWWAKRPAHQQGSDKSSKRRQSQKLVSHSILCTGPIENLIIVMGDITKTYVFFSQDDISDNSRATDNKFIVKVPIKQQAVPLGTNLKAAIAQNHRSNYMEDLLEYGYMIQVELQSLSQQATYFIIWWAKQPAHQQDSDKSSKRRQSQKLVSHSILCTGPIENLIIVMGDITKPYVFFSQDDISDNSKHSRSPEEDYSEKLYKNATNRATDNKFIVKVPIKQQAVPLGTNQKAAIAQNHRLSAKSKKDSYYNDMYSNYMEDLLEYGYMTQVELQSSSQQATYLIMRWTKRPAHQQGSDKTSKRRQSQKLVSHSILCTGPNENPIIVMGDITKTYLQVWIMESQRHLLRIVWNPNQPARVKHY